MAQAEIGNNTVVPVDDPAVFRAIEQIAAERQRDPGEIVTLALREWLEREEAREDLVAMSEAEGEPVIPWNEVKAELRAARAAHRDG